MKITFVLLGNSLTGGHRVIFEYANRLTDRGHKVCVVYPIVPLIDVGRKFKLKNLAWQAFETLKTLKRNNKASWFDLKARLIRVPTVSPRFSKYVERLIPNADIVIATAWETAYLVAALSNKKGVKFYFVQHYEIWDVWDDQDCWEEALKIAGNADSNELALAMAYVTPKDRDLKEMKGLVDETYALPLKKVTIATWLKDLIESKFDGEVESVITNGVNFETFHTEIVARNQDKQIRILMPSRPYKNKGTEDGIKAFELVREKYPATEFVLYGQKWRDDVPEWIKLYENVSDDELRRLYSSSDIFVLPSWVEGCQLPILEAMACGCAVVATNVGGVPDYAINGETILASPPREYRLLAQNIIKLVENADERIRIARNGCEYIQQFSWEHATNCLENVFRKYA